MKIRKNDTVLVIAGRDKGKKGKVRNAYPKKQVLLVEGVNFIKKHARATKQARQAGIKTETCISGCIQYTTMVFLP